MQGQPQIPEDEMCRTGEEASVIPNSDTAERTWDVEPDPADLGPSSAVSLFCDLRQMSCFVSLVLSVVLGNTNTFFLGFLEG